MGLVWPHGVVQEMSRRVGPLFQPACPTVEKGGRRPTAWPRVGRTQKTWMSQPPPGKWRLGYGVTWVWPELCGCPPEPAVCRRQADAAGTAQLHLLLTLYGNPTLISGWGCGVRSKEPRGWPLRRVGRGTQGQLTGPWLCTYHPHPTGSHCGSLPTAGTQAWDVPACRERGRGPCPKTALCTAMAPSSGKFRTSRQSALPHSVWRKQLR